MSTMIDCTTEAGLDAGIEAARQALGRQQCVVLPTDTVYGIGADAFSPQAVAVLLAAKGRGRSMPPPVLIGAAQVMDGLAVDVPGAARELAEAFWPGALTLILTAQPSLAWDLGQTRGTVALRVPDDQVARELLQEVGPMAVSSANRTGLPAATSARAAEEMLGEMVAVYLDDGDRRLSAPSTIVDCTVSPFRVVRQGALPHAELAAVVPELQPVAVEGAKDAGSATEAESAGNVKDAGAGDAADSGDGTVAAEVAGPEDGTDPGNDGGSAVPSGR